SLQGAGAEALHRHLWFDVLHAHWLPRPARDHRRDHADRDLAAGAAWPLHPEAPFRLRGRRLVLALRRRRVARPVHLRLLAVAQSAAHYGTQATLPAGYLRSWGAISPTRHASIRSRNSTRDSAMRTVSALLSLRDSSSLPRPPRDRCSRADPRLTTMAPSTRSISTRIKSCMVKQRRMTAAVLSGIP